MELLVEPLEVINVRSSTQPGQVGTEVLIRWKGLPAFEDSWEKFEFLMEKFPHVNLEDKVRVWAAGAASAKLVAQKTKGMPVISISLAKLTGPAASAAIANLSLQLFKAFKSTRELFVEEQNRSVMLTKVISAEREKSESLLKQLDQYSRRPKLQRTNSTDNAGVSALLNNGLQCPGRNKQLGIQYQQRLPIVLCLHIEGLEYGAYFYRILKIVKMARSNDI
ncbi:uncharacterized protein LOC133801929 isoform X2 [Humulus lupulus]|uniref:uncharacterized protein LOC133801929 isoform X2 n=1 Tax=Humulus lupulus TaxID=3486 RepID=UPI002B4086D4|nr:uncharacterized protein LOC133801929 isoform X2 [Humulus lupulus]XP_062096155.1 uncharacterized protein LOC133801929 isoform X2 [Humulus lupulus]XP_062096160.1 uncharacterized protein LOC133801929 isoform X2 [Humulus lupulus]XP_062096170.1 uncharacterized protein LOC133801929 isoform X2 [Humulus lupulus]XP_062096176.1 uncharacterized protein LOC133801929 isoform X2 [Humulus lupulus]